MGKTVNDIVLDAPLNLVKTTGVLLTVCSAQPTNYEDATGLYMIAQIPMAQTDYTITDGDISGRKAVVATKVGVTTNAGISNHLAICSDTLVLYTDTCAPKEFTAGEPIVVNSWKIEFGDPL